MENKNCSNGKCDLKDQTEDDILESINSEDDVGFGFLLFEDSSKGRGHRKDIFKDITYNDIITLANEYDECVAFKFIPYGYNKKLDELVSNMVDGPFHEQIPKK